MSMISYGTRFELLCYPGEPVISPIRYPWELTLFTESTSVLDWHSGYKHIGWRPRLSRKVLCGKTWTGEITPKYRQRYEEGRLFPLYFQGVGQRWSLDPFTEGSFPVGFLNRVYNDPYGKGSDKDKAQEIVDRLGSYYRQETIPIRIHSFDMRKSTVVDFLYYPSERESLWLMVRGLLPSPTETMDPFLVDEKVLQLFPELKAWRIFVVGPHSHYSRFSG